MSEAAFETEVIKWAQNFGWLVHHSRKSRTPDGQRWETAIKGDKGLPDLVLARDGIVMLRELKTDKGTLSKEQRAWLAAAGPLGGVWRPRIWAVIMDELRNGPGPASERVSNPPPRSPDVVPFRPRPAVPARGRRVRLVPVDPARPRFGPLH